MIPSATRPNGSWVRSGVQMLGIQLELREGFCESIMQELTRLTRGGPVSFIFNGVWNTWPSGLQSSVCVRY